MKLTTRLIAGLLFVLFFSNAQSQVTFWSENWSTGGVGWSLNVPMGAEGADANFFTISAAEGGGITPDLGAAGSCGVANNGNNTLHVTSVWNPTGGAAYDAGGLCGFLYCPQANRRCESPVINCTGRNTITLRFNYIENGQTTLDNASVYYYNGSTWALLNDMAKTGTGCGGQGLWTSRAIALPASADNNANVRIAFLWVNNDDGAGTDPSFAVDDIRLTVASGAAPVADFSASDTTICVGDCISFTDLSTNIPTSWAWTFTGGTPGTSTAQNPASICYNTAGTYTVSLTATNANGNNTKTRTSYITVTALPAVTISPTYDSICFGQSQTFTASGATSYSWSPATGLNITTGPTVIATPASTTTYTVTGTTNGCTGSATVTVTVTPIPVLITIPLSTTICLGDSDTLGVSGANSYTWSPASGLSCTNCASPVANPVGNTTYTVTGNTFGCTSSAQVQVNVVPALVANAGTDDTICNGGSVGLLASGGSSYTWSPATNLSCTNCSNPIASPTGTTTYTVTVGSGSCTPATDAVTITVLTAPLANAGVDDTICQGGSTVLNASGGGTYSWSPSTNLSCTNCFNPTANPATTTTYTVTVSNGYCTASDAVTIRVDLPVTANAGVDTAFCAGSNVQLNASGGGNYTWSPTSGLSCFNCASPVASPGTTTSYTVTVTNGVCPAATDAVLVTNKPLPLADAGSPATICAGDTTTLDAGGGGTYSWSPSTNLSCTTCEMPQAWPASNITYTVTVNLNGCTATDGVLVTVNAAIVADAGNTASICSGDSTQLNASGGSTYLWSPATGLSCTNCQNPQAAPAVTTTYTVLVSNGSCTPATDVVTVTVNPIPVASISGDNLVCSGSPSILTASGGTTYVWAPSGATTPSISVSPTLPTTYTVTATTAGCSDTATFSVGILTTEVVNAWPDTSILIGTTVQLNTSGGETWNWSPALSLSCSDCSNPIASPEITTTYTVFATDSNGCSSVDYVTIEIMNDCGAVYIPNAFSPNGDNYNDVIYVRGNCINYMEFYIYDRWGEKVFSGNENTDGWDGIYRGEMMESGVFYYSLKATLFDETVVKKHGTISLIR